MKTENSHTSPEIITDDEAWELAAEESKCPPYRGYAFRLADGRLLACDPSGKYIITNPLP